MTELNRIRELAGMTVSEAEQEVWTPSQEELDAEQDARAADRYDLEAKIEKNVRYAFQKVGLELKDGHNIYWDDDTTLEVQIEYDATGIPLKRLVALSQTGIGSDFSLSPSGDWMMVRFIIDPDLVNATPAD